MISRWFALCLVMICSVSSAQERQTLKPKAIGKLLPERIDRYTLSHDSRSSMMKIGTLRYSLCERIFSKGKQTVKILLFDYVEAPVMLTQSMKRWQEMPTIDTDSITFSKNENEFGDVWSSSHPRLERAQLVMIINNRFFLTVEAEKMTIEQLNDFAKAIDFEKFPK